MLVELQFILCIWFLLFTVLFTMRCPRVKMESNRVRAWLTERNSICNSPRAIESDAKKLTTLLPGGSVPPRMDLLQLSSQMTGTRPAFIDFSFPLFLIHVRNPRRLLLLTCFKPLIWFVWLCVGNLIAI